MGASQVTLSLSLWHLENGDNKNFVKIGESKAITKSKPKLSLSQWQKRRARNSKEIDVIQLGTRRKEILRRGLNKDRICCLGKQRVYSPQRH